MSASLRSRLRVIALIALALGASACATSSINDGTRASTPAVSPSREGKLVALDEVMVPFPGNHALGAVVAVELAPGASLASFSKDKAEDLVRGILTRQSPTAAITTAGQERLRSDLTAAVKGAFPGTVSQVLLTDVVRE